MLRLIFPLICLLSAVAHADLNQTDWNLEKGQLTYHVNFPLKKVTGVSDTVKGKGHCDDKTCEFLIAAPVKSFVSGDGNRDNHMLEVTKAGPFPMVTVRLRMNKPLTIGALHPTADVNFGGESHSYPVEVEVKQQAGAVIATGSIPLKLTDFKMERPSLLTVRIDDEVPVDFDLRWK